MTHASVFDARERFVELGGFVAVVFGTCAPHEAMLNAILRRLCNGGRRVRRGRA